MCCIICGRRAAIRSCLKENRFPILATVAGAQDNAPLPLLPDRLRWISPPILSGVPVAWVLGAESTPGPYRRRAKLAAGARIPPPTHPDARQSNVLAGTLYVRFGETFDDTKVVAIPTGAVSVAPTTVPHAVGAKDGEVMYQEAGVGPTGTTLLNR